MGKIGIIIQREFNERVRKRTFIVTTLLTPLLIVAIMFVPALLMHYNASGTKTILVVDESNVIARNLESNERIEYRISDRTVEQLRTQESPGDEFGFLYIGPDIIENPKNVRLYTHKSSTIELEGEIAGDIRGVIEAEKLKSYDIENLPQILDEIKTPVSLQAYQIDSTGQERESSSVLSMILAMLFGVLIYFFVFLYGGMVMQGVIEEKRSKVLEIMVCSVKPFQMMMGKIVGVALVALTQFLIWVVLISVLGTLGLQLFAGDMIANASGMVAETGMGGVGAMGLENIDPESAALIAQLTDVGFLIRIFGGFLIYFIGGYLLYAAMFAAIGSAVENDTDSQQLQMPVTIPLLLAFFVLINVMKDPHSSLAVWFSIIPFTSPIIMMARLPYGVPIWEFALSVALLYATFLVFVWFAGKIYRVGIFMYGKKPSLTEFIKWARYKT